MENRVERFIDAEFANYLGNLVLVLDRKDETTPDPAQVIGAKVGYSNPAFDLLLALLKPKVEKAMGKDYILLTPFLEYIRMGMT